MTLKRVGTLQASTSLPPPPDLPLRAWFTLQELQIQGSPLATRKLEQWYSECGPRPGSISIPCDKAASPC